jgi:Fic family protein
MTAPDREAPPDTAQADRLYRGFPDFSAWGELLPSDVDLWGRFASSLEERRKTATPEALNAAVEVAVRAAALDTGAIEGLYTTDRGFTMTVALQHLAWEQMIEERGAGVRELFEAQLEAYELVLDAVTRKLPITEAWIRALHEKLCGPQKTYRVRTELGWQEQELPKGQYKTLPNHVLLADGSFHAYAPVDRVPDEMHRLLGQIRTPKFEAAHPVLQASYIHYAFVVIHPFADGNGRVARALASVFFYRAESVPLVIFSNQRPAYLDGLSMADRGQYRPILVFFRDRGIDTIQLASESLIPSETPRLQELRARFGNLPQSWTGLDNSEIDLIVQRVLGKIQEGFQQKIEELRMEGLFGEVQIAALSGSLPEPPPPYQLASSQVADVVLKSRIPPSAISHIFIYVFCSTIPNPFPILIDNWSNSDPLEARLEDLHPELTPHFLLRLDQWIQRQLRSMLVDIEHQADL